jgi:hypothetical protein
MAVVVPLPDAATITKTCAAYDFTKMADVQALVEGTWYGSYMTGAFVTEPTILANLMTMTGMTEAQLASFYSTTVVPALDASTPAVWITGSFGYALMESQGDNYDKYGCSIAKSRNNPHSTISLAD